VLGHRPRRSRRQLGEVFGEIGKAGLIGEGGRQSHLDAGDHLGDAPRHLDLITVVDGDCPDQAAFGVQAQGRSSARRLFGQLLTSLVRTSVK
jgi:hypothetical protein